MPPPDTLSRPRLFKLPPNRVWRTYQGGRTLDEIAGADDPADSHFPEDWVASVTRAVNPGRESIAEGISTVRVGDTDISLPDLLAADPEYFLGHDHVRAFGPDPRLLVKILDPSIRLHLQVHPTAEFARQHLGSPSGKAEAYRILEVREDQRDPHVYMGFRHDIAKETLRRWIRQQDIAGIKNAMHRISVRPGDTLFVPGGCPHALGAGILLVEIQEPTDWVVRFEFERGGYTLPKEARFMGRGLEFCLDVFDRAGSPIEALRTAAVPHPSAVDGEDGVWQTEQLIGPATTPCFRLHRTRVHKPTTLRNDGFSIGIVTDGAADLEVDSSRLSLRRFDKCLLPAAAGEYRVHPHDNGVTLLECRPPEPVISS